MILQILEDGDPGSVLSCGIYRTKEDDVYKISTSVFIMNFPESCSAKELYQSCKQYGHVMDTFIPNKRSKTGRRFGFVRFINVFNEERLVNNLCTVWIDRFKLHANIARFHRTPLNEKKSMPKKAGGVKKDTGVNEVGNSYVRVVKGQMQPINKESEVTHASVLSDECLLSKDLSKSLFGRVKQFASLANIRKVVSNEGFADIKIQYMGELWVLLEFISEDSMKLFQDNGELLDIDDQDEMFFHSKRLCIYTKSEKNIFEEFKIIFRGRAFWIRAKEAPGWVPDFIEENDNEEHNDDGGFNVRESGSCGGDSNVEGVLEIIFEESGQKENNLDEEHTDKQENHSMKYPSGFTPKEGTDVVGMHAEESRSDNIVNLSDYNAKEENNTFSCNFPKKNSKEDVSNSVCLGHFKTSMVPRIGGSILSLMDKLVKVGQVMGYKIDGCMSNMTEIIESQGVKEVNFLALQETKMENIELFSVKMCWGKIVFDYVHSDSVGNSRGILCVWDPNFFCKSNTTDSDYFIMIRGVWRQTGNDLLIIAVYAHHDLKDKHMLWDYLTYEIGKWKWEVVIIGDFNEVRYKSDRFGLVFNVQGDNVFNSFITNARLEEVPLDFFHHWIEMEGFSKVVEDAWREGPSKYKDELKALEVIIDKGDGNVEVVNKRMEVVNTLQKIDKICSSEMAQKAKVKWSIEGDENTSFFHGCHFSSIFDKPDARRAHIDMRYPKTLTCDQQVELESDVSNEEIKRAVWDYGIDKSPGPDGFTFGFYRRFWNLIENDVYDAVKYFFTYVVIPKGCNSSFIALILKIPDANTVHDFRPISLIGSLYKVVAKILANRLVGVLGDIVNEVQSAFIAR
nr:hydroxycinnamoyl-CoA quinate/shikimate transferase [Tanacetum cinerariifolium]